LALDFASLLTIVLGNGVLIAVFTLIFNYYTSKRERSQEARKEAKELYMTLYSHIAYVQELLNYYIISKDMSPEERVKIFTRDEGFQDLDKVEIGTYFVEAAMILDDYIRQKICEGYGIYISTKFRKILMELGGARSAVIAARTDKEKWENLDIANEMAEKARQHMEKLFGLR
jgi:hypothetical protein